jgi:hypothetical protein
VLAWLVSVISLPMCFMSVISPYSCLILNVPLYVVAPVSSSAVYLYPVIKLLLRRFDLFFIGGNMLVMSFCGLVIFDDNITGGLWLGEMFLGLILLFGDSVGRRSRMTTVLYVVFSLFAWLLYGGLFFESFAVHDVEFPVLNDVVSIKTRAMSSSLNCAIFLTRFAATSIRSPWHLILLPGLRNVKVPHITAEGICKAYSLQARRIAAVAESRGATSAVAPRPPRRASLAVLAALALRDAGGDAGAAKTTLVAALDELSVLHMEQHRHNTVVLKETLVGRWADHAEDSFERVLVPRFVPTVVDSKRTIAAALAGESLSDLCYSICRTPAFVCLNVAIVPTAFAVNIYVLCGRGSTGAVHVMYVLIAAAFVLNSFHALLWNTEILRHVLLQRFDTFWSLANIATVALTGALVFEDPQHGLVWAAAQLQTSLYFFQDASPPSRMARRITCVSFSIYAVYQVAAVLAIWQHVFTVAPYIITILGMPMDLKQWLFAAQVNAAIIATRFAVRALSDEHNLIFCAGLRRVRMPAADARELRALMLAEREVAVKRGARSTISKQGTSAS